MSKADTASMAHQLLTGAFGTSAQGVLEVDGIAVNALAQRFGTPLFIYSAAQMRAALTRLRAATHQRCDLFYSIKANPHPAVVRVLHEAGAGAEIASGAEYEVARRAGVAPSRIVFAGPGKSDAELHHVISRGIAEIHVEAADELIRIASIAEQTKTRVAVSLRINPADAALGGSMRMGGKAIQFGIDEEQLDAVLALLTQSPMLDLAGIHLFAGTQILDAEVLLKQWAHGLALGKRIARQTGKPVSTIDLGGGLGIPYFAHEQALDLALIEARFGALMASLDDEPLLADTRIILEPGRFLAGPAGIYLSRVVSVKESRGECFAITDGGMHHHLAASGNLGQVIKRDFPLLMANRVQDAHADKVTVVGPLCTPLDTYGRKTPLPKPQPGDLIAIMQSGAYGLSASPIGFLSQPIAAEALIDNGQVQLIREAGSFEQPLKPAIC